MSDDLYQILALGVQALRRRAEALTLAMGGALGVAAEPYPHQLATVKRVLTDTAVRHLIADEVGLGKTVQALMILNALRWQNGRHKAVILVPDRLVKQWQDECWTRCHCKAAVVGETTPEGKDTFVRIVRPQSIQSGEFTLDPGVYDLLVVDEPQTLPNDVMEKVERAAPQFRQMLMLSATPGLGDPSRRRKILRIVEPDRVQAAEYAGLAPEEYLDRLEQEALSRLEADGEARGLGEVLFRTFSSERRIARSRRADWGKYLPQRQYENVTVEPLEGEARRVQLGMEWLSTKKDRWLEASRFAQALHRGHQSARRAINARQDKGEKSQLLLDASAATASAIGDSRFDALLEILSDIWAKDSESKVVIVAGDNPTINFLSSRLPDYLALPEDLSELRRQTESLENEYEDVKAMHELLNDFTRGAARLLMVGEWVQAGLNLHYFADNVVFYSTPWDAEAIDQLVGRLDRLRPNGLALAERNGRRKLVRIWTITQRGTVESHVVSGLDATGVFRRPLPPVAPAETDLMAESLRRLALGEDRAGALAKLKDLAGHWDGGWQRSRLAHLSPFTPGAAQQCYEALQSAPLPEPAQGRNLKRSGPYIQRAETALRGWTQMMSKAGMFDAPHIKDSEETQYFRLSHSGKRDAAPFAVDELNDGVYPFIYKRAHLTVPPRNTTSGEPGSPLLHFLDHGDVVHERLVRGFRELLVSKLASDKTPPSLVVQFPEGHPALALQGQNVMIVVAWADPSSGLMAFPEGRLGALVDAANTPAQKRDLTTDVHAAREAWRADLRWVRSILPAQLMFEGGQMSGAQWLPLARELAAEFLRPLYYGEAGTLCARGRHGMVNVPGDIATKGVRELSHRLVVEFATAWQDPRERLKEVLAGRLMQVEAECRDIEDNWGAEIERRRNMKAGAGEQTKEGLVTAAQRRLEMAAAIRKARLEWLSSIPTVVAQTKLQKVGALIIKPTPMETSALHHKPN